MLPSLRLPTVVALTLGVAATAATLSPPGRSLLSPLALPTITSVSPAANADAAPTSSPITVTFSDNLTPGSASALQVFSSQRGGLRTRGTTAAVVSGNTLTFTPSAYDFAPGETVSATVTRAAASSGGNLASPRVVRFTAATGGTGTGYFVAPATTPNPAVGSSPYSVAVGDVDGDGNLDVLTANQGANTVSVLRNGGSGSFTLASSPATGTSPRGVAVGDVDGDGNLDVLTANQGANTVSVLRNDGSGTFTLASSPATGTSPWSVAVGDVDGDGDLDVLTANQGANTVSILRNDGSGSFTLASSPATGTSPWSVAVGDVDGDGDLDVLTANGSANTVSVLRNDGSGTFTLASSPATGSFPRSVVTGDMDGDGDLDLFTVNQEANTVSVLRNNGSGSFTLASSPATGAYPRGIAMGDIDSDGDLDLLTANYTGNTVSALLNNGSGTFTLGSSPAVGAGLFSVAVGDVDDDGDLDLLTANTGNSTVSVRLNQVTPPTITSFSPRSVVAGNSVTVTGTNLTNVTGFTLNGTSVPLSAITNSTATSFRFVVPAGVPATGTSSVTTLGGTANYSAFVVRFTLNSTNPTINARNVPVANSAVSLTFSELPSSASAANLRVFSAQVGGLKAGNRTLSGSTLTYTSSLTGTRANFMPGEVVSVTLPTTVLSGGGIAAPKRVYQFTTATSGPGRGTFTPPATYPNFSKGSYNTQVVGGDVDGDGDLDMLTANSGANAVSVLLNDGKGSFTFSSSCAVGTTPRSVAVGDVDGDGDLDVLTANGSANTVSVLLNNGSGTFTLSSSLAVGTTPQSVAVGDVDGDGDLDVFTANFGSNTVSVLRNNGSGTFTLASSPAVGSYPWDLAVGDVNGDGNLDVLTINGGSNTVSVLLNNGSGSFTLGSSPSTNTSEGPRAIAVGDIDGDGDLDVLTANSTEDSVSILRNDGSGTFTTTVFSITYGTEDNDVAVGDVDADGDLDVLTVNSNDQTVSVLLNNGSGSFTLGSSPSASYNSGNSMALGDLDGDGDLDMLVPSQGTVSVRLNRSPPPTITSFSPTSGVAGTTVTVTGTNLTNITAFNLNGKAVPLSAITPISATSFSFVVPVGMSSTGTSSVTADGGTTSSTGFTVRFTLNSTDPVANANSAPRANSALGLTFSEPPASASAANLKVFSSQIGGLKAGTKTVNGNTLAYSSSLTGSRTNFMPGELVNVTVPATVTSTGNIASPKRVYQFTTATGGTGQGTFVTPVTDGSPAVGASPAGVAIGDVNGDGNLDIITPNYNTSGTVSILTNNGSSIFTLTSSPAVGSNPYGVAVGDVNGDGNLDVLTANQSANTVSVLRNNGSGTFTLASSPAVGNSPNKVAVGDLDGDGDLDVLTANSGANTVSVLTNNGSGTFTLASSPAVGNSPRGITVGDIDNDGDLDVLTANYGANTVSVLRNNGNGAFTLVASPGVGTNPWSVALGDIDDDGDLDVLTANYGANTVSVLRNDGSSAFTLASSPAVGTLPIGLAMGDVDSDGDLDVLTANQADGTVSLLRNDGSGTYTLVSSPSAGTNPRMVAMGDIDGDGDLDVLASNDTPSGTVKILLNQAPTVVSFAPAQGPVGTTMAITGTYLAGTTAITFTGTSGNTVTTGFTVNAAGTQITGIVVPPGAQTGVVKITTSIGQFASTTIFTVCSPVATTKDATLTLDATGRVTLTPDLVNNGSQADCGVAPASALSVSPSSFTCANLGDNLVTLTVTDSKGNTNSTTATVTVSTDASLTSTTWTGNSSTNWTECGNWSYGQVPTATIGAIVPAGRTNYPVLASGTMNVNEVTLASGASLTVNSGATLNVNGNWTNDGATTLDGQVHFTGSLATQTLGGSAPTTFGTLVVDKASGTVQLDRSVGIASSLIMTSGTLRTGNYLVTLGANASIGETDNSYVLGQVQATRDLSSRGGGDGFGGLGVLLQVDQNSPSVPGTVVATRTTGTALTGAGTSTSLQRWFRLTPTTDQNLNVALSFSYFPHELNGIPVTNLQLFSAATPSGGGATSGPWTSYNATPLGNGNAVQVTGLTHLSDWTLGNRAAPLPVRLTGFAAQLLGPEAVGMSWQTASEANTERFEVERSTDGVRFTRLATLAAHGASTTAQSYAYRDAALPAGATLLYYRLRIVDYDRSSVYSPVRALAPVAAALPALPALALSVAPNPAVASAPASLWVTSPAAGPATLTILTAIGQVVSTRSLVLSAGTQQLPLAVQQLPAGIYTLRLQTDGHAALTKLLIL
jgi:6-phosphogluconolactonase (cycloisomerase 2 family)